MRDRTGQVWAFEDHGAVVNVLIFLGPGTRQEDLERTRHPVLLCAQGAACAMPEYDWESFEDLPGFRRWL